VENCTLISVIGSLPDIARSRSKILFDSSTVLQTTAKIEQPIAVSQIGSHPEIAGGIGQIYVAVPPYGTMLSLFP
jgi:hypothetical protein